MVSRLLYGTRHPPHGIDRAGDRRRGSGRLVGILAAYYRRVDGLLMRLMDVLLSFPAILFGLAIAAVTGPGLLPIIIALAVATIPLLARIARASALVIMQQDYIDAARSVGLGDAAIDLAIPGAQLPVLDLRVQHPPLRADHPDRGGPQLPRPRRATADGRARHDGRQRT